MGGQRGVRAKGHSGEGPGGLADERTGGRVWGWVGGGGGRVGEQAGGRRARLGGGR